MPFDGLFIVSDDSPNPMAICVRTLRYPIWLATSLSYKPENLSAASAFRRFHRKSSSRLAPFCFNWFIVHCVGALSGRQRKRRVPCRKRSSVE